MRLTPVSLEGAGVFFCEGMVTPALPVAVPAPVQEAALPVEASEILPLADGEPQPQPISAPAVPAGPTAEQTAVYQFQRQQAQLAQQQQALAAQQRQVAEQRAETSQRDIYARAYASAQSEIQQRIDQGQEPGLAREAAEHKWALSAERQIRAQLATERQQQDKMDGAVYLSQHTGMPVPALMAYQTPDEMIMAAQQYVQSMGPRNQEIEALKAQVAALTRGQVPVQKYAQPGGAAGRQVATRDNVDALYVNWERDHPNQTGNPYEGQYRKFLGM